MGTFKSQKHYLIQRLTCLHNAIIGQSEQYHGRHVQVRFPHIISSQNDILLENGADEQIGFYNNALITNTTSGHPIIIDNPFDPPERPIGYYIPDEDYTVTIYPYVNEVNFSLFGETKAYIYSRLDADTSQQDKLIYGDDDFTIENKDPQRKTFNFDALKIESNKEKVFSVNYKNLADDESVKFKFEGENDFKIFNNGAFKNYNLKKDDLISFYKQKINDDLKNLSSKKQFAENMLKSDLTNNIERLVLAKRGGLSIKEILVNMRSRAEPSKCYVSLNLLLFPFILIKSFIKCLVLNPRVRGI